jgi:hypothetical protein
MMRPGLPVLATLAALGVFGPVGSARSQTPTAPAEAASAAQMLQAAQLDQLLAPVALYPDPLLAQVLMAATYPLEVVQAARWASDPANAALTGDQITAALRAQNWDASVKSLVPFPRILQMMDGDLDWMQAVGNAVLAQQADVMDAVQRLRQRAQAAGYLPPSGQGSGHEIINNSGDDISIEPAGGSVLYVPVYSPEVVFAPWPYPDYPPDSLASPAGFDLDSDPVLWWDAPIVGSLWGWCGWHWHDHHLYTTPWRFRGDAPGHRPMPGGNWQRDPGHRMGVRYGDLHTAVRFAPGVPGGRQAVARGMGGASDIPNGRVDVQRVPEGAGWGGGDRGSAPGPRLAMPRGAPPMFEPFRFGGGAGGRAGQMSIPSHAFAGGHFAGFSGGRPR